MILSDTVKMKEYQEVSVMILPRCCFCFRVSYAPSYTVELFFLMYLCCLGALKDNDINIETEGERLNHFRNSISTCYVKTEAVIYTI